MITFNTNATEAVKKAAMKLAIRYKSITVEEINAVTDNEFLPRRITNELTGFGKEKTCKLCEAAVSCSSCIYSSKYSEYHCNRDYNAFTYYDILLAETPEQMVVAFKKRAEYIEEILALIEKNPEKT